jgi:hypothetical protein
LQQVKMKVLPRERGSILLLAAIVLPVLLGLAALALDAGYMFDYRQRMGAAADAAAVAGAFEIKRSFAIDSATLNPYIRDDATRNGFTDGTGGVTVTISRPPVTGLHIGDANYVEVVIAKPTPTFFARIFGLNTVTVNARAVAGPQDGSGCVYALSAADPAKAYPIEFDIPKSGTHINVPNCAIVSNGDFNVISGSSIDSAAQILVGAAARTGTGTVNPTPTYNVAPSADPFGDMDQAGLFGTAWTCGWSGTRTPTGGGVKTNISGVGSALITSSGNNYTLNPGVYCGSGGNEGIKIGLKVNTPDPPGTCNTAVDDVVNFSPGIYIVVGGGLDWKHTCVTGTGVVFYFTGTSANPYAACGGNMLSTDPPDRFFFTAPTSTTSGFKKWDGTSTSPAPYEGLLFIQDRRQGSGAAGAFPAVNCTSAAVANPVIADMLPQNMILDGAIYFPNEHIVYGATSLSGGTYTILIGGTLEFKGNATFNSNFTGLANGSPIKRPGLGE